jgi:Transposase IS116/IS110/IS902 family
MKALPSPAAPVDGTPLSDSDPSTAWPVHPRPRPPPLHRIALVSAVTIASEVGTLSRFTKPRQLMGYSGAVASEDSSGERTRRGGVRKAGNAHLRRVVIEAAWAHRHRPAVGSTLRKRQAPVSPEVKEIAWKAQHRLHASYSALAARGSTRALVRGSSRRITIMRFRRANIRVINRRDRRPLRSPV